MKLCLLRQLGKNVAGKVTKLSKISFSIERFTDDFLQFSKTTAQICLLVGWLGTSHQLQAFQGFSKSFLIS